MAAFTVEDLVEALKRGDDTIEIKGDLAKKTITIKATGRVAWLIAFGAIVIATGIAIAFIPTAGATGGGSVPPSSAGFVAVSVTAASILGFPTASAAIAVAVAARGTSVLTKLRDEYRVSSQTEEGVVLSRIIA